MVKKAYWIKENIISSLGLGKEEHLDSLINGKSGLTLFDSYWAGAIDWTKIELLDGYTRLESLIIQCINGLSFDFKKGNIGMIFSTTKGNIDLLKGDSQESICQNTEDYDTRLLLGNMAQRIVDFYHVDTKPVVISNACISGLSALIMAQRWLEVGTYDHVIVVGADLLSSFVVEGFQSFKSMDEDKCRPFDKDRKGLSLGEACGAVLLSSNKALVQNKSSCVQLVGGCITNDANHISGPSRTGDGLFNAISGALNEANISSKDISFLSPHGTATLYNDEMESKAIALAHLSHCPINSFKPYLGHTLGACGVVETIISVWQLQTNQVFATLGYKENGVSNPLEVSSEIQHTEGDYALKMGSGFGGCNAALILSKKESLIKEETSAIPIEIATIKTVEITNDSSYISFKEHIRALYKNLNSPNLKFYKMDDLSKLGYVLSEQLLKDFVLPENRCKVAIIMTNKFSSLKSDANHQRLLDLNESVSPSIFVYTLPNIVSGEICIRHKLKGENTFFITDDTIETIVEYGKLLIEREVADTVIYGSCECFNSNYNGKLSIMQIK